jgi:hypothetical protein
VVLFAGEGSWVALAGRTAAKLQLAAGEAAHPRYQTNLRMFDPLDLPAEVGARIPDPHEKTMLLSGWYPNRTRGPRKQHGLIGKA